MSLPKRPPCCVKPVENVPLLPSKSTLSLNTIPILPNFSAKSARAASGFKYSLSPIDPTKAFTLCNTAGSCIL